MFVWGVLQKRSIPERVPGGNHALLERGGRVGWLPLFKGRKGPGCRSARTNARGDSLTRECTGRRLLCWLGLETMRTARQTPSGAGEGSVQVLT